MERKIKINKTDFPKNLLDWYNKHRRTMPWREKPSPYRVWISEIMLQQTQVATVIPYFERFTERFPSVEALAQADQQDVLKLWEGLGYYSRARNLHKAARSLVADYGGKLPTTCRELLKVTGIGPYTAAAIASIAFGEAEAVVDGNVIRVASRLWMLSGDTKKQAFRQDIRERLNEIIPKDVPGDFNQGMMELGALGCSPRNPDCAHCPLTVDCAAFSNDAVDQFPSPVKRKKTPHYDVAVAIILNGDTFLVAQRREDQMLGGMWELPGGKIETGETPEQAVIRECMEELQVPLDSGKKLPLVKHAYSHFSVTLHPFICELRNASPDAPVANSATQLRWITQEQIADLPFPTATLKVFEKWRNVVSGV